MHSRLWPARSGGRVLGHLRPLRKRSERCIRRSLGGSRIDAIRGTGRPETGPVDLLRGKSKHGRLLAERDYVRVEGHSRARVTQVLSRLESEQEEKFP